MTRVFKFAMPFLQGSLVKQILVGLVLGIILGMAAPEAAKGAGFLGTIFVTALKGVAPILVFVLVMSSIANQRLGEDLHIKPILVLYMISTSARPFSPSSRASSGPRRSHSLRMPNPWLRRAAFLKSLKT